MEGKNSYATFEALRPHFDALAKLGYYKIVLRPVSPIKHAVHELYRKIAWVIVITYNLQHIIRVIQVRHSTDQIVDVLFILLTILNALGKQLAFNARSHRVDRLITTIDGPIFAATKPYHVKVMKESAAPMHRVLRLYLCCIFTCGSLWAVFPLVNRYLGADVQFTGYIPFDTHSSPMFELAAVYMACSVTFQAFGHGVMDCTIPAFYAQGKVQLQILRYNLEHLVDLDDEIQDYSALTKDSAIFLDLQNTKNKQLIRTKFVNCVMHHQRIIWFTKEVESIFGEAVLFQFFVTAWVICMTVYKLVSIDAFSTEFFLMISYLCCMMSQLAFYCYYGTQLKYESEFVNQSAYCGGWLSLSPAFRRQLVLMMINCSRPILLRAAYIIPISLETYLAVLRASYTLFTFLNRK